jgi:hypothetical protein
MDFLKNELTKSRATEKAKDHIYKNFIHNKDYNVFDLKDYIKSLDEETKNRLIYHYIDVLSNSKAIAKNITSVIHFKEKEYRLFKKCVRRFVDKQTYKVIADEYNREVNKLREEWKNE